MESQSTAATDRASHGHLVIVGGGEDREEDKQILSRFVELSGGPGANIVVITGASQIPQEMWEVYDRAFTDLGVTEHTPIHISSRAQANDRELAERVANADGIFMTGGDQRRLLATIGGTELDAAMHRALKVRGACIGGTSAGASAMSGHMLADGHVELQPELGSVHLAAGLGFLQRVVIDQHFSERHRLARLLTVVAQNPYLQGIGIDEDTALVVERGGGIEVIGRGAVTILDGRHMISNVADTAHRACPQLIDVRLHLLPTGSRFELSEDAAAPEGVPKPLLDFLRNLIKRNPMS
ncbi:cyanophycinase [Massilia arenosa]|uniref:Cyanophycinase n=1 Tax=Zemynaea arenosa TaxID=2561931 RepID=A0A4Y9RQZ1_9BURK|nr:cyanophycinase [Massilia arenosa]TFW11322.1 cyanophycinase [Massilia arenosa]